MKYPITAGALVLIGISLVATVVYRIVTAETCNPAITFTVPKPTPNNPGNIFNETKLFANKRGYRYMDLNSDNKTLTLYGASDSDKLIVGVDSSNQKQIGFSFFDCRQGGNASATADSWLATIGQRYIK